MKNNRYENIDLLKGMVIIIVVLFHLTFFHQGGQIIRRFCTPFFMQLFFFVSGIFFTKKKSFVEYITNKINRLIIPLLFFYFSNYFIGFLASHLLKFGDTGLVDKFSFYSLLDLFNGKEHFTYSGALWFIVCLFNVYILYYFINLINNSAIKWILVFSLSIFSYTLSSLEINIPYFIDSSLSVLPFFYLGHFLKSHKIFLNTHKYDYIILIFSSILYLSVIYSFNVSCEIMQNRFVGNYMLILIGALLGISLHFYLTKVINTMSIINYFGKNTLIILGTHQLLIVSYAIVLKKIFSFDSILLIMFNLFLTMTTEILVIQILNKLFLSFVGKRDIIKLNK